MSKLDRLLDETPEWLFWYGEALFALDREFPAAIASHPIVIEGVPHVWGSMA